MDPEEIKALRERLGWLQHELAEHLGITQSSVSRIEAGVQEPSKPVLKLLELLRDEEAAGLDERAA